MNRRHFINTTTLLGIGATALPALAQRRDEDLFVINLLGGISNPNRPRPASDRAQSGIDLPPLELDVRSRTDAVASGMAAVNATLGYVAGPMDPFEHTVNEIARWNWRINTYSDHLLKVWNAADIERAHRENKVGIIMGFQNATMMGENAGRVATFAHLGVKIIQLTYNGPNQLGDGSMVPENGGVTPFGYDVIEALHEHKVLVDLSHSGQQTCLDAIRASTRPIAITHTGCRAITDTPRNKTDEEMRLVAEGGGIVGIYFMPFLAPDSFADAEDVVQHIEHAVNVCGEDHVGIGTDGGTTQIDDMDAYRAAVNDQIARRQAAGISASGEKPGVVPMVPDLQGPSQFQQLAKMLAARGHSTERIEKILGYNALRVLKDVWGG